MIKIKLSLISFVSAFGILTVSIIGSEGQWFATVYLLILFLLTVVPMILMAKQRGSYLTTLLLTPVLLFSLGSLFLRLGLFNVFRYIEESWHPFISQEILQKAAWLVILGNIALWVGYSFPFLKRIGEYLRIYPINWVRYEVKVSEYRIWLLFIIGLLARLYFLRNNLGGYFSYDPSARTDALGYIQYIGLLENLTALSLVVYFSLQLLRGRQANWTGFSLMLAIELSTVFLMGFKGQVVYRLIYLIIAYAYIRGKFSWKLIAIGVIVLIVIMPVNLLMRSEYAGGYSDIESGRVGTIVFGTLDALGEVVSGQTDFTFISAPERLIRQSAEMQDFAMAIQYVDRTGFTMNGAELLNLIYSFIPRAIWPSKPIASLGRWFSMVVYGGSSSSAAAITVPGDFYLNFGWLGVPLGMLVYGAFLRVVTVGVLEIKPNIRLAALVPFIILDLGLPSSELGSHLGGLIRQIIFFTVVLSLFLMPRESIDTPSRDGSITNSKLSPEAIEIKGDS